MLPLPDRLGRIDSPHKRHFPYTHSLLAAKAADSRKGLSQLQPSSGQPMGSPLSPTTTTANSLSSSHSLAAQTEVTWLRKRGYSNLPYLSPTGPPMTAEERRLSSPPSLQLRVVQPHQESSLSTAVRPDTAVAIPQVTSPSPYHIRRQSAHIITNIPTSERDNMSLQTKGSRTSSMSFSFKNLLWGSGWRKGGGGSGASSINTGNGSEGGETAEEKLRRIIQEQANRRNRKLGGGGLSSSLPIWRRLCFSSSNLCPFLFCCLILDMCIAVQGSGMYTV